MSLQNLFTPNEVLDEFVDRDPTTCVIGYVESIQAPVKAGDKDELLFKFVLSNGSKKVQVLIWGSSLIDQHIDLIRCQKVININGAFCKTSTLTPQRHEQNFIPFEIIVKEYTELLSLGTFSLTSNSNIGLTIVDFESIRTVTGLVQITGYIRTKIAMMHSRSGNMCYGVGAITNGTQRLTLQIKQFTSSDLELGDPVTVTGIVQDQDSIITVYCRDMTCVTLNPDAEHLPIEEVYRGNRAVKRARNN